MLSTSFKQNADKAFSIQLPRKDAQWHQDAEAASRVIRPVGAVVYVEMLGYESESGGGILLPDSAQRRLRPDAGMVVAIGPDVIGLSVGDKVLVKPYDGNWFSIGRLGAYVPFQFVRCYGVDSRNEWNPSNTPWEESILGKITLEDTDTVVRATGPWVFIKRDKTKTETKGGLVLPDSVRHPDGVATVVSVGRQGYAKGITPGQRIHYHQPATYQADFGEMFGLGEDADDYAFIRFSDIYAVLEV